MRTILLLLMVSVTSMSFGQHATCDGTRYAYETYTVQDSLDILYGNATTFGGTNQDLYLDFFEPQGDQAAARPLIILAFGGSFIQGTRQDMHWMCEYFSSLGYATASIDYRLYDGPFFPIPDSVDMTTEVLMAVSDMKAAVRHFKEDAATANNYRIDSNYIFVGGISSGGIVASHVALLDSTDTVEPYITPLIAANGGWTGNSANNTQYTDNVRGLLNYSGALRKASYIDANDPPFFAAHDDNDNVVPYAFGWASIFSQPIITLEGSYLMDAQAQTVGVNSQLVTIPNSNGHVSYFGTSAGVDSILAMSTTFLFDIVCPQFSGLNETAQEASISVYPNPVEGILLVETQDAADAVMLTDFNGRIIHEYTLHNQSLEIDMTSLSSGVYFVHVNGPNGTEVREVVKL